MKLSKLYTNKPKRFAPISFAEGLNVVLAEIRLPENRSKDTHNLGKTTLGRVIDFCLLAGRDPDFFLFKHEDLFKAFVFFLEIKLLDGSYVTIRRSVEEATKISFKRHTQGERDFTDLPETSWDHTSLAFEKARDLLDGLLDLRDLKPWTYRKVVGYLVRSQDDFREVFHLKKFASGHSDWKPFLAHLLGFNSSIISLHYDKEDELSRKKGEEDVIKRELGGSVVDVSKIEGMLHLKQTEAEKKQRLLDAFDFRQSDKQKTKVVVDELDTKIARLNSERYSLLQNKKKITVSIEDDEILFDPKSAAELFAEAGILFAGQIKREFEQLLDFNRAITEERRGYLKEELAEVEGELKRINAEILELNKRRMETLSFLGESDHFAKYKQVSNELVALRADITSLERQREFLRRLQDLRASIRALAEEKSHLQMRIEADVEQQNAEKTSQFSTIRVFFSEIVEEVINRKALLSVAPNQQGHLEFKAEILDDSGNSTSADLGFTYRKLLCVAFDLALARVHVDGRYPRFLYHDGVFESLDDRKKQNLMEVIRSYSSLGIQHLITLIDSDLPASLEGEAPFFQDSEVILRLHDEDESGRLFRMRAW
ncbi:DUF2326 domain-containing protein [Geothrix sp. SG200]|uniref:DUF2326 domain-containing protein n=1 Tax=Geothrix sp. SG200 TaxID=2922865 RepID=UPI001FACE9DF|nr:DUF2326 domain-containing protein [Geothrix sp. SG200]